MSLALSGLKVNGFAIQSIDGSKTIDLSASSSILFLDYFEDILSPCITMTVQVMNSTSLVNVLPIRGGEKVFLSIDTAFGEFEFDGENSLYVSGVAGVVPDSTAETFSLNLVSREAITNETARCLRKYSGSIDQTVTKILKDDLKTDKFKNDNIEKTANGYSFIGNQKKPFHILTWICPKSMPSTKSTGASGTSGKGSTGEAKGVSGYLFYENKDGFNFRSIDSLVKDTKIQVGSSDSENIPTYVYTPITENNNIANEFRVLNYYIEKNNDLLKNLRIGMYSNYTYFYDFYTFGFDSFKYNLKDEIKNANILGADANVALSDNLGSSPSRILFRTSDRGVMDVQGGNDKEKFKISGRDNADMAKSFSRYNLLFTQALNMVVPCNVNLKVGSIVKVEFPRINPTDRVEVDDSQSGYYLIKELRHHMEPETMVTSLRLIRDSYGLYTS
jgi:hypothetical protein